MSAELQHHEVISHELARQMMASAEVEAERATTRDRQLIAACQREVLFISARCASLTAQAELIIGTAPLSDTYAALIQARNDLGNALRALDRVS